MKKKNKSNQRDVRMNLIYTTSIVYVQMLKQVSLSHINSISYTFLNRYTFHACDSKMTFIEVPSYSSASHETFKSISTYNLFWSFQVNQNYLLYVRGIIVEYIYMSNKRSVLRRQS